MLDLLVEIMFSQAHCSNALVRSLFMPLKHRDRDHCLKSGNIPKNWWWPDSSQPCVFHMICLEFTCHERGFVGVKVSYREYSTVYAHPLFQDLWLSESFNFAIILRDLVKHLSYESRNSLQAIWRACTHWLGGLCPSDQL